MDFRVAHLTLLPFSKKVLAQGLSAWTLHAFHVHALASSDTLKTRLLR